MMLTIGKPAEFGTDGFPLRGQCQPYTKGWMLKVHEEGTVTVLYTDTYHACRQMQLACSGKTISEMKEIIQSRINLHTHDLQETAVFANEEETQALPATLHTSGEESPPAAKRNNGIDTVRLPKDEMAAILRKRRKDFEF